MKLWNIYEHYGNEDSPVTPVFICIYQSKANPDIYTECKKIRYKSPTFTHLPKLYLVAKHVASIDILNASITVSICFYVDSKTKIILNRDGVFGIVAVPRKVKKDAWLEISLVLGLGTHPRHSVMRTRRDSPIASEITKLKKIVKKWEKSCVCHW